MKAYIFTGGEIFHQYIEEKPEGDDLVIAADAGYKNAKLMGAHINILIGDFDSLGDVPGDVDEVFKLPAEKDVTDTQIAVDMAVERGADEIVIVGSTSGRLDHTFANLQMLAYGTSLGLDITVTDGENEAFLLCPGKAVLQKKEGFSLSLFSYGEKASGISLTGAKYPLENGELTNLFPLGLSNEIISDKAELSFTSGMLLVIISKLN